MLSDFIKQIKSPYSSSTSAIQFMNKIIRDLRYLQVITAYTKIINLPEMTLFICLHSMHFEPVQKHLQRTLNLEIQLLSNYNKKISYHHRYQSGEQSSRYQAHKVLQSSLKGNNFIINIQQQQIVPLQANHEDFKLRQLKAKKQIPLQELVASVSSSNNGPIPKQRGQVTVKVEYKRSPFEATFIFFVWYEKIHRIKPSARQQEEVRSQRFVSQADDNSSYCLSKSKAEQALLCTNYTNNKSSIQENPQHSSGGYFLCETCIQLDNDKEKEQEVTIVPRYSQILNVNSQFNPLESRRKIYRNFTKGPCKNKNVFSCLDQQVQGHKFSIIQRKYHDIL